PRVRELCRFTTHTPVEAGHDRFPYDLVDRLLASSAYTNHDRHPGTVSNGAGWPVQANFLKALAGPDYLNMTRLALAVSDFVNGVAKRHAEVSAKMYPGYQVRAITNGVHPFTWTTGSLRSVFDQYVPGWYHEPELLARADAIPDGLLLDGHRVAKQLLIDK